VIELGARVRYGTLFKGMLKEEWRLQRSFVGSIGAFFFPLFIFILSLILVIIFPFKEASSSSLVDFIHLMMFLYGLSVGGIALISEQVMARRIGQVNLLLKISQLQTVSFRRVTALFFLKEVFFYQIYSIIPFGAGMVIGGAISGIDLSGTIGVAFTIGMVFTLGMSVSFLASGALVRSRIAGILVIIAAVSCISILALLGPLEPVQFLHPLYLWHTMDPVWIPVSLGEIGLFSILSIFLMKERISRPSRRYKSRIVRIAGTFFGTPKERMLLAKEWLELKRSGTLGPVIAGFMAPLLAVYGMVFLFNEGLGAGIDFNVVFFGALIGFFGVMTYSWLNNVEPNESFNVIPVTVPELIRIKLRLYFLFTTLISTLYIIIVGVIEGDLTLIPFGILVGASTNFYVAYVTARLTGLRTNSMLLDIRTVSIFSVFVVPPLITLVILSFYVGNRGPLTLIVISAVSMLLVGMGYIFKSTIEDRWGSDTFGS
jgi:hypothetical protein